MVLVTRYSEGVSPHLFTAYPQLRGCVPSPFSKGDIPSLYGLPSTQRVCPLSFIHSGKTLLQYYNEGFQIILTEITH